METAAHVQVWAPASLSNLGPGFDALGLALEGLGDLVEAWWSETPGITLLPAHRGTPTYPLDPPKNTASVAAAAVLQQLGETRGVVLRIQKGVVPGSGLGSSAASAVGGALVVNALCGNPLNKQALIQAVLAGEAVASGARHGDNVLPSLLGGLVLIDPTDPTRFQKVDVATTLHLAVIHPDVVVHTREARALLPASVSLADAVHNAAHLGFLIDAFHRGDLSAIGRHIMQEAVVEPRRATLVPCYETVKAAAKKAGAFGCALSGSGPSMFAVCEHQAQAQDVATAMQDAAQSLGVSSRVYHTRADARGARVVQGLI